MTAPTRKKKSFVSPTTAGKWFLRLTYSYKLIYITPLLSYPLVYIFLPSLFPPIPTFRNLEEAVAHVEKRDREKECDANHD